MSLPEGLYGRILALLLLAVASAVVFVLAVQPLVSGYSEREAAIRFAREQLERYQTAAADLPALKAAWASRPPVPAQDEWMLPGRDQLVAAAELLALVRGVVMEAGGEIISLESLPAEAEANVNRPWREIGVRVRLTGGLPIVTEILERLAAVQPHLRIDALELRRDEAQAGATPNLSVGLDVLGFIAA